MSEDAGERPRIDLATFTPYRIAILGREISERLGAAYASEGVAIPEWRVLAVVAQADSVAARDVVARTPMDKMAVSRAVATLEEKGLVARTPAADRRVSALKLTRKGRAVYGRIAEIALGYEARLLSALGDRDREAFFACLQKLESALGSAADSEETRAAE